MELHEEIRRARKDLGLSQDRLAELCGIQRRQLSILERGGNVTLNTLRKVIGFLPNLQEFTFEQVLPKYFSELGPGPALGPSPVCTQTPWVNFDRK